MPVVHPALGEITAHLGRLHQKYLQLQQHEAAAGRRLQQGGDGGSSGGGGGGTSSAPPLTPAKAALAPTVVAGVALPVPTPMALLEALSQPPPARPPQLPPPRLPPPPTLPPPSSQRNGGDASSELESAKQALQFLDTLATDLGGPPQPTSAQQPALQQPAKQQQQQQ